MKSGGRVAATLFLCFFLGMGTFFAYLILNDVGDRAASRSWQQTPCKIEESSYTVSSKERDAGYRFAVRYSYTFDGRPYTSTQVTLGDQAEKRFEPVQRLMDSHPDGSQALCYVNPDDPSQAVLMHASLSLAFFIILPIVFIVIATLGIWAIWRGGGGDKSGSSRGKSNAQNGMGCLFIGLILAGLIFGLPFGLIPGYRWLKAQTWTPTDCVVESSVVRVQRGDDGDTYSADILYRYEVDGQTYRSSDYSPFRVSSSGRSSKSAITREYRKGSKHTCYVNESDPAQAMLQRRLKPFYLVAFLLPLAAIFGGFAGLGRTAMKRIAGPSSPKDTIIPGIPPPDKVLGRQLSSGAYLLKTRSSRLGRLIVIILVTAVFGIGFYFMAAEAIQSMQKGRPQVILSIMTGVFGLVVIGLIVACFYNFLAIFNPRPTVAIPRQVLRVGEEIELRWRMQGRAERIAELSITLVGQESASYRRGTRTYTDTHDFTRLTLLHTDDPATMRRGGVVLRLPADTMHSMDAGSNKIQWFLEIEGDIPNFPDLKEHIDLVFLPADPHGAA